MAALLFSETSPLLIVFQFLTVVAPTLFFATASIVSSFSSTPASKAGSQAVRIAQLSLTGIAAILSSAQAVIDIKRSDPSKASDPDAVYGLFLTLTYVILFLGLTDHTAVASYPHHGAWAILLVCEGIVFALSISKYSWEDKSMLAHNIFQGLQLFIILVLLSGTLTAQYLQAKPSMGCEEETQPLLANEISPDGPNKSAGAKQDTDDDDDDENDTDRLRIRNRPFWQYVASFRVLLPYMYPKSRKLQLYFIGICLLSMLTRVVLIAIPLALGAVVNGLGDFVPWNAIAAYVLLKYFASQAGFPLLENWLSHRLNVDLILALQRHCYDHIMNLSADFHDSKKSSVIWQIMHQGQDVINLLHNLLFEFLPTMVDLLSVVVVLTYLFGLYITFIVATTAVLFYWMTYKTLITKRVMWRSWLDAYHDQYYQMSESTYNWSTVCYFGRIPYETQKYREKGDITRSRMLLWWSWEFWSRGMRHIIPCITFIAACSVAAFQISQRRLNVGDFVVLITYWSQLTVPLTSIAGELSRLTERLVNAEKLVALLEKTPQVKDSSDARNFTFLEGAVQFENVSFSYDSKRQVTKGLTFRAAPGKTIALVGQTGGGKSTILRLLFRFYDVDQGRILIDGQDIRQLKMETFRKHIAIVPQNPVVFNMSILENVRYPDIDCTEEDVIAACKAAALHDKIMSFTHGYKEKVGERGTKLSGGELQRLAIARAILKKADILLLDEATSSVDSITEMKIQGSIRQLCAGKTAFVIAHRLSTILGADHILVIGDGQILESGTHDALIKNKGGAYNELWRSQIRLAAEETACSKSQNRSSQTEKSNLMVNDLSINGEGTQTLVNNTSMGKKDETSAQQKDGVTDKVSNAYESGRRSHELSHSATELRGRMHSKTPARTVEKKISLSIPPRKDAHTASSLNPSAPTFRASRSVSPLKHKSSDSVLNPEVPAFRPRRFQDGNISTSFSGEDLSPTLANKENDCPDLVGKELELGGHLGRAPGLPIPEAFHPKRKLTGRGQETLDSNEDPIASDAKEPQRYLGSADTKATNPKLRENEQDQVLHLAGNARRRQTASEPFPENAVEANSADNPSDESDISPSVKYSRLPQMSARRALSAIERKTKHTGQSSNEQSHDDLEPRAPTNTATTSPGILTPK